MEHLRSPALASASASASIPWSSLSPPTSLDTEALPLSRKRLASPPSPHEVIGDIIRLCPSASETLSGVRDRTSYKNLVKNANNTGRKVEGQVAHHLASMLEASIESQEGMEMLDMPVQIGLDQPISKFVAAGTDTVPYSLTRPQVCIREWRQRDRSTSKSTKMQSMTTEPSARTQSASPWSDAQDTPPSGTPLTSRTSLFTQGTIEPDLLIYAEHKEQLPALDALDALDAPDAPAPQKKRKKAAKGTVSGDVEADDAEIDRSITFAVSLVGEHKMDTAAWPEASGRQCFAQLFLQLASAHEALNTPFGYALVKTRYSRVIVLEPGSFAVEVKKVDEVASRDAVEGESVGEDVLGAEDMDGVQTTDGVLADRKEKGRVLIYKAINFLRHTELFSLLAHDIQTPKDAEDMYAGLQPLWDQVVAGVDLLAMLPYQRPLPKLPDTAGRSVGDTFDRVRTAILQSRQEVAVARSKDLEACGALALGQHNKFKKEYKIDLLAGRTYHTEGEADSSDPSGNNKDSLNNETEPSEEHDEDDTSEDDNDGDSSGGDDPDQPDERDDDDPGHDSPPSPTSSYDGDDSQSPPRPGHPEGGASNPHDGPQPGGQGGSSGRQGGEDGLASALPGVKEADSDHEVDIDSWRRGIDMSSSIAGGNTASGNFESPLKVDSRRSPVHDLDALDDLIPYDCDAETYEEAALYPEIVEELDFSVALVSPTDMDTMIQELVAFARAALAGRGTPELSEPSSQTTDPDTSMETIPYLLDLSPATRVQGRSDKRRARGGGAGAPV